MGLRIPVASRREVPRRRSSCVQSWKPPRPPASWNHARDEEWVYNYEMVFPQERLDLEYKIVRWFKSWTHLGTRHLFYLGTAICVHSGDHQCSSGLLGGRLTWGYWSESVCPDIGLSRRLPSVCCKPSSTRVILLWPRRQRSRRK